MKNILKKSPSEKTELKDFTNKDIENLFKNKRIEVKYGNKIFYLYLEDWKANELAEKWVIPQLQFRKIALESEAGVTVWDYLFHLEDNFVEQAYSFWHYHSVYTAVHEQLQKQVDLLKSYSNISEIADENKEEIAETLEEEK